MFINIGPRRSSTHIGKGKGKEKESTYPMWGKSIVSMVDSILFQCNYITARDELTHFEHVRVLSALPKSELPMRREHVVDLVSNHHICGTYGISFIVLPKRHRKRKYF